jgi:hypothetical protein
MSAEVSFQSLDRFTIDGRGDVFVVALDRDTSDFAHLLNRTVLVDGRLVEVSGVERFAHSPPWRKGESIGLLKAGSAPNP